MNKPFSLIVTDTSPLFTLVLADALDALLRPGAGVTERLWEVSDIVALVHAAETKPTARGPYRKRGA